MALLLVPCFAQGSPGEQGPSGASGPAGPRVSPRLSHDLQAGLEHPGGSRGERVPTAGPCPAVIRFLTGTWVGAGGDDSAQAGWPRSPLLLSRRVLPAPLVLPAKTVSTGCPAPLAPPAPAVAPVMSAPSYVSAPPPLPAQSRLPSSPAHHPPPPPPAGSTRPTRPPWSSRSPQWRFRLQLPAPAAPGEGPRRWALLPSRRRQRDARPGPGG